MKSSIEIFWLESVKNHTFGLPNGRVKETGGWNMRLKAFKVGVVRACKKAGEIPDI
jgi:hypothetical protein